ncbi:hypothetical protein QBC40DRAFT_317299, partial [Triangularia verruculosa]
QTLIQLLPTTTLSILSANFRQHRTVSLFFILVFNRVLIWFRHTMGRQNGFLPLLPLKVEEDPDNKQLFGVLSELTVQTNHPITFVFRIHKNNTERNRMRNFLGFIVYHTSDFHRAIAEGFHFSDRNLEFNGSTIRDHNDYQLDRLDLWAKVIQKIAPWDRDDVPRELVERIVQGTEDKPLSGRTWRMQGGEGKDAWEGEIRLYASWETQLCDLEVREELAGACVMEVRRYTEKGEGKMYSFFPEWSMKGKWEGNYCLVEDWVPRWVPWWSWTVNGEVYDGNGPRSVQLRQR